MYNHRILFLSLWIFFSLWQVASAQTKVFLRPPQDQNPKDPSERRFSLHAENNQIIDARVSPPIQYLNGDVKVFHSDAFMYCDTAIIRGHILRMRHNVAMLQSDTIRLFADSMVYNADSLVAYLYGDIILEDGNKKLFTNFLRYNVGTRTAEYTQGATLQQDSSLVISRKGKYFVPQKLAVFKDSVRILGSDFILYTDSIGYETDNQKARFLSPARIYRDTVNVYAETGWFDLDDKRGDFIQNAQYQSNTTSALADTIHYDGLQDLIILSSISGLSRYYSATDTAIARVIKYDRKNESYTLRDSVYYKGVENEVTGAFVEYNKKTQNFKTLGRATVSDPPMIITADTLDYDKSIKFGLGHGEVIWQDTSANTTIYADHVLYRGQENFMLAYNNPGSRPHFTTLMDTSLLHMKADTLRSFRKIITRDSLTNDTIDYFTGYHQVRVYKENLQMVCDSIVYNLQDSVFTLYSDPIAWSDTSQIKGDTLFFYIKNKAMDKMSIHENGSVLTSEDLIFFDQVKGTLIEAGFENGKMKNMRVDGDAEVLYYIKDDQKSYIGVNQSRSSYITFRLDENKITDILFYIDVKSKVFPMNTNHEQLKIKGFQWIPERRPKNVDDL